MLQNVTEAQVSDTTGDASCIEAWAKIISFADSLNKTVVKFFVEELRIFHSLVCKEYAYWHEHNGRKPHTSEYAGYALFGKFLSEGIEHIKQHEESDRKNKW